MTLRSLAAATAVAMLFIMCAVAIFLATSKKGAAHYFALVPQLEVVCPPPARVTALLVLGQSQAANFGELRMIPSRPGSYEFANGRCWPLQDPIRGSTGEGGSIWPAFVDAYGAPVLIANLAVSGSSIKLWTEPAQREKVRAALSSMRRAGYRPTIVWMNGETDAAARMSAQEYLRRLKILAEDTGDARWFISRESRCYEISGKYLPLDEARDEFVRLDPARRKIGPDLDTVGDELRNPDRCHLGREGQLIFGRMMAEQFREAWRS